MSGLLTLRVDIDGLLACHGVCSDDGMLSDNGLAPLESAAGHGGISLLDAGVGCLETVKTLLEERAKTVVSLDSIGEESVASSLRLVEDVEEGGSRRLLLVGHVRVPGDRAEPGLEEIVDALVPRSSVYEMNLGITFGRSRGRVDVMAAEVGTIVEGLLDRQILQVLVTEGHDLALRHEASQLVLARGSKRAQLDATNFGADGGGEVNRLRPGWEEIRVGSVGILAVLYVLKRLQRRILLLGIPSRKVVRVLFVLSAAVAARGPDPQLRLTLAAACPFFPSSASLSTVLVPASTL